MLGMAGPSSHLEFLHRIEVFIQLDRLDFLILQMHDQMLTIYGISHWILYEDLMPAKGRTRRFRQSLGSEAMARSTAAPRPRTRPR